MAEIPGVTIDFTDYSAPGTPRIANIPEAAGDVNVQDLWDTYSAIGAELDNLIYKPLINRPRGGGKSTLSAIKAVGITLVQNNVQTKFPDQPGPAWVIKRVVDGNLVAIDHLGNDMEALANSDFTNWKNEADVSAAILNQVTLLAQLKDLWQRFGLDPSNPATFNKTLAEVIAGDVEIDISGDNQNVTTFTRRP